MIPSGYKEDVVYSPIPTTGAGDLSFTRASNGTRINSAGLVEVTPWNMLEYSEQFSNAYWYAEAGNTVTSNSTTAPNGTLTADTITATSGNEINLHNFASFTITANTYTLSHYLKSNGTNLIQTYIYNISTGFAALGEINFANGTYTASIGTGSIENVGNGWYRVSLTASLASGSITTGVFTTSTTGTRSAFVWGAQLNIGSTAKPYFPTTDRLNVPRLTYQNGGGGCPSLLLEKQSTNLCLWSEQFDNAAWSTAGSTVTANNTTSPDGTQNADLLTFNVTSYPSIYQAVTTTNGATYTASIYAKKGNQNFLGLEIRGSSSTTDTVFNLNTGVVVSGTGTIENVGNGWYRCSITKAANSTSTLLIIGRGDTAAIGDTVYLWGAQFE